MLNPANRIGDLTIVEPATRTLRNAGDPAGVTTTIGCPEHFRASSRTFLVWDDNTRSQAFPATTRMDQNGTGYGLNGLPINLTGQWAAAWTAFSTLGLWRDAPASYVVTCDPGDVWDGQPIGAERPIGDAKYFTARLQIDGTHDTWVWVREGWHVVTPSAGPGGSISPAGIQSVAQGQARAFTVTPNPGYWVQVGGTCGGALEGNVYTTLPVGADCTVEASFSLATATATASVSGGHGSISPEAQTVDYGQTATFAVTPEPGYTASVSGCGGALSGDTYTTAALTQDCHVTASFSLATVTVTASVSGGHGSIEPATQTLNYGQAATLTVTPEPGYNALVEGCGGVLSGAIYTTASLTEDCHVTASFARFSETDVSVNVRVGLASAGTAAICANGEASIEVPFDSRVRWCAILTNNTGRTLRWPTVVRGAYEGDLNGVNLLYPLDENLTLAPGASANFTSVTAFDAKRSTDIRVTWSAHDANDTLPVYVYNDTAQFEPIDLAASPNAIRLALDRPRASTGVTLPFRFNFYGIPTDVLCVGYDGVLAPALETCDLMAGYDVYGSGGLGQLFDPRLLIAVAFRNGPGFVSGYASGDVYYEVQGAAPNRRVVFEWNDMTIYGIEGPGTTFQAIIEEATGAITLQYVSMVVGDAAVDNGYGADAGLQRSREYFQRYGAMAAVANLTDGKAIRWTPDGVQPFTTLATASAHVTVLAPEITVEPAAIQVQARAGSVTAETLALGNLGNAPLDWNIETASGSGRGFAFAKAHVPTAVHAPKKAPEAAVRSVPGPVPDGATAQDPASVPAYAHAYGGGSSRIVSLDAATPTVLTNTNFDVNVNPVHAGGFVDNDFTQLFLLQTPGRSLDAFWNGELYRTNPAASSAKRSILYGVGTVPLWGESWRGMRWDPATNVLFAVASDFSGPYGPPPPYRTDLYRIDPVSGQVKHVARLDDAGIEGTALADIAIDNDGNVYGIDMGTDTLVAIDKTNGHLRPIGPTGLNVSYWNEQSTDFDHSTGLLYYATWTIDSTVGNQMFIVDTETGEARLIGTIGNGVSGLRALSIAVPGGPCSGADAASWLLLSHSGGSIGALDLDTVEVTLDAGNLDAGTYRANLCIGNDTPYRRQVTVPVTFTVLGDSVFADGFE